MSDIKLALGNWHDEPEPADIVNDRIDQLIKQSGMNDKQSAVIKAVLTNGS